MLKKLLPILLLAFVFRFFNLSHLPAGINADEAALGYNAWSLYLTGYDEHYHPIPVNLESFGDFKPALYSYLLVPLVGPFGLSDFLVRLPSALFGVVGVFAFYILVRHLTRSLPPLTRFRLTVPDLAAFFLAISPWAIHFSRGAWEVNVSTTLLLIGTALFLSYSRHATFKSLFLGVICFGLAMYTYQSTRLIAPLLGLALLISHLHLLKSRLTHLLLAFVLLLGLLAPLIYTVFTSDAGSRLSGVGLLADEGPLNRVKEFRGQYPGGPPPLAKLVHNRPVIYSLQFIKNYLTHFDGNFLFINGDPIDRNRTPETGLLYLTDLPLILLGVFFVLRYRLNTGHTLWLWLVIAPIASALTFQVPHALRAHNLVVPLTALSAIGGYYLLKLISPLKFRYFLLTLIGILGLWQVTRYWHEYQVHYTYDLPQAWEVGFKSLAQYLTTYGSKYDHLIITDTYDQPYILLLYYLQVPPIEFQRHHQLTFRDRFNFSTVKSFGKFEFTNTSWDLVRDRRQSLIIAAPGDIPAAGANVIDTLLFPNGRPAFKIVAN